MAELNFERTIRVKRTIPNEYFTAAWYLYTSGRKIDGKSLTGALKALGVEAEEDLVKTMLEISDVVNTACPV